jgi:hypothetical protein
LPVFSSEQQGFAESSLHLVDLDDWRRVAQRRRNITEASDIEPKITSTTLKVFGIEKSAICISKQILFGNCLS